MGMVRKRTTFTVPAEYKAALERLKREKFSNQSHAEMFRYLIGCGLREASKENPENHQNVDSV